MISKESIMNFGDVNRVLIRNIDFAYLLPHPALQNWISNYTITFPRVGMMTDEYTVMPHGSATMVFSCNERTISSNLFGPITKPAMVGHHANQYKLLFIVEFQPGGYYAFSKMPQSELTDSILSFEMVNLPLNELIARHIETAPNVLSLITEIDRLFLAHLKTSYYKQEFSLTNEMIIHSGGLASVKELSQNVYYSERHLNRIFEKYMGMNIKSFSRLVRVNKVMRILRRRNFSLTQAYLETGFYDLPHFIHDFKSICGITPQEYRNNMSDFYSEIAKF